MNISILRIVVIGLVLAVLLAVVGMIILAIQGDSIPGTLETVALAGFTGLLGLLAPSKPVTDPNI